MDHSYNLLHELVNFDDLFFLYHVYGHPTNRTTSVESAVYGDALAEDGDLGVVGGLEVVGDLGVVGALAVDGDLGVVDAKEVMGALAVEGGLRAADLLHALLQGQAGMLQNAP